MVSIRNLPLTVEPGELAQKLAGSHDEVLILAADHPSPVVDAVIRETFAQSDALAGCVVEGAADPTVARIREELPAPLAAAIAAPREGDVLALRCSPQWAANPSMPAWDLLFDIALGGGRIQWTRGGDDSTETEPAADSLPALAPSTPRNGWLRDRLSAVETWIHKVAGRSSEAITVTAGLWLLHDFLDESHSRAQSVEHEGRHRNGDYWHAIMHRREPDYGNSKYWFHQVGRHPVFVELAAEAARLLREAEQGPPDPWPGRLLSARGWEPDAFVDLCRAAAERPGSELEHFARRVQWTEMLLLLARSWRDATLGSR